jgi:hypothetical protein
MDHAGHQALAVADLPLFPLKGLIDLIDADNLTDETLPRIVGLRPLPTPPADLMEVSEINLIGQSDALPRICEVSDHPNTPVPNCTIWSRS